MRFFATVLFSSICPFTVDMDCTRESIDKRDVVREALRVVKRGGAFSFQDLFAQKSLYGDMDAFVEELKKEGISEIHYIGNLEKTLDFVPAYVRTPWMISGMGILYGKK